MNALSDSKGKLLEAMAIAARGWRYAGQTHFVVSSHVAARYFTKEVIITGGVPGAQSKLKGKTVQRMGSVSRVSPTAELWSM